jgi:hypothetical protein
MSIDLAVVIPSCDAYADLWPLWHACTTRYWPDCIYPKYLISNHKTFGAPDLGMLNIGNDISWSANLKKGLRLISADYVLLFLEDLFLTAPVDTRLLTQILTAAAQDPPNYINLYGRPRPNYPHNQFYGEVRRATLYRCSTVLSLWKRETLLALLDDAESAWHFELQGSLRSDNYEAFYVCYKSPFQFINGVIKRLWRRDAVQRLQRRGFRPNLTLRRSMSRKEQFFFKFDLACSKALQVVPAPYRRALRGLFRRS